MSVPANWRAVTLGEVCEFKYGRSLPEAERAGGDVPVFGSNGEVGKHDEPITIGPTIVIGRKGSFGEVNYSRVACWPIDTTYYIDESATEADLRWLTYRLSALGLNRLNRAAAVPGLNREDAYRQRLLLPPPTEQRRIADILDKADALRTMRRATIAGFDTLTQSIFREMFLKTLDGPAIDVAIKRSGVPEGWSWELLTDVARLATGHTPDRERQDYWSGDIPWISLTDIRDLDGTVAKQTLQSVTDLGIQHSSAVRLPAGTVCLSRTASVGFVTVMGREMATSQDFVNWVCGPRVMPTYLMWALRDAKWRLRALSSGSTHKTIYMRVVEQFRVLVPPAKLQREFSTRVDRITGIKDSFRDALARLDSLFGALQYRAFRGDL